VNILSQPAYLFSGKLIKQLQLKWQDVTGPNTQLDVFCCLLFLTREATGRHGKISCDLTA
jgi:hypothetical protein